MSPSFSAIRRSGLPNHRIAMCGDLPYSRLLHCRARAAAIVYGGAVAVCYLHMTSHDADRGDLADFAVLIPSRQPTEVLLHLVSALRDLGLRHIIVVDDGSAEKCQPIFMQLEVAGHTVLRHAVNLGKGRALKTGFNYLLRRHPDLLGVVTADADGQHSAPDILRVAQALLLAPKRPVLGVRSFIGDVPLRSKFGNAVTRLIFAFITGVNLTDTQTGLRGLPMPLLPSLMRLDGERYEYETTVLAAICSGGGKPFEVSIETIYIDGNQSSHFNPVRDSMRIYFVLARFLASSILASGIDFLVFTLAFAVSHNLALSVVTGRLSSVVNFALNRRFVFHNRGPVMEELWRYYALVAAVGLLSYVLVRLTVQRLHWNVLAAKLCVDVALSLVSFSMQRTFVFRRSEAE